MTKNRKKVSKITMPNGNKYTGETKGLLRHGHGVFTWTDGTKYTGNWVNGEMNGKGTIKYPSGHSYEGSFKDGVYEGKGKLIYQDGAKYVGMLKDGLEHGEGTLTYTDGFIFQGEFVEGRPLGGEENLSEYTPVEPMAEEWAKKNAWFGVDESMTDSALKFHKKLMDNEISAASEEYYEKLDTLLIAKFPEKFSVQKKIA